MISDEEIRFTKSYINWKGNASQRKMNKNTKTSNNRKGVTL